MGIIPARPGWSFSLESRLSGGDAGEVNRPHRFPVFGGHGSDLNAHTESESNFHIRLDRCVVRGVVSVTFALAHMKYRGGRHGRQDRKRGASTKSALGSERSRRPTEPGVLPKDARRRPP